MKRGHNRHPAELDMFESAVPAARMSDASGDIALAQFGEIEPGTEMLALAVENDGFDAIRHGRKKLFDSRDGIVIQRIALVWARQTQNADSAALLELQRRRKLTGRSMLAVRHRQKAFRPKAVQSSLRTCTRRGQATHI
jgi:hypothetical protein